MESLIDAVFVSSLNGGITSIQVYDAATGTILKAYNGTAASSSSLNFVGQSEYLIAGQKDKPILQAWIMNRSDPLQIRLAVPGRVGVMAVNSSGPLYCAIAIGENIFLYKLASGRLIGVFKQHYQTITCLKFTQCGFYLISGGEDGLVLRWNIRYILDALHCVDDVPEPHYKLAQHSDHVTDISASSGVQSNLISTSLDCTANIYDVISGQLRHTIIITEGINCVANNSLGNHLYLGSINGNVWTMKLLPHLLTSRTAIDEESKFKCHNGKMTNIEVSAAGSHLFTGGEDGEVKVWRVTSTNSTNNIALLRTLQTGRGAVTNVKLLRMEREILNATEIQTTDIISPIASSTTSDLTTEVTINVTSKEREYNVTTNQIFGESGNKKLTSKPVQSIDEIEDLKSNVELLKTSNAELYKYVVKHILGPD